MEEIVTEHFLCAKQFARLVKVHISDLYTAIFLLSLMHFIYPSTSVLILACWFSVRAQFKCCQFSESFPYTSKFT